MSKLIGYENMLKTYSATTNQYMQYELKGRTIANQIFKQNKDIQHIGYIDLKNEFAIIDGMFISGGTRMVFELKHRANMHSENSTWWIDSNKVNKIKEIKKQYPEYKYIIITTTKDNKMIIWDVDSHDDDQINNVVQLTQTNDKKGEKTFYVYNIKNSFIIL